MSKVYEQDEIARMKTFSSFQNKSLSFQDFSTNNPTQHFFRAFNSFYPLCRFLLFFRLCSFSNSSSLLPKIFRSASLLGKMMGILVGIGKWGLSSSSQFIDFCLLIKWFRKKRKQHRGLQRIFVLVRQHLSNATKQHQFNKHTHTI